MAKSRLHSLIPIRFVKIFGIMASRFEKHIVTKCQILEKSKPFGGYLIGLPNKDPFNILVVNKTPCNENAPGACFNTN